VRRRKIFKKKTDEMSVVDTKGRPIKGVSFDGNTSTGELRKAVAVSEILRARR